MSFKSILRNAKPLHNLANLSGEGEIFCCTGRAEQTNVSALRAKLYLWGQKLNLALPQKSSYTYISPCCLVFPSPPPPHYWYSFFLSLTWSIEIFNCTLSMSSSQLLQFPVSLSSQISDLHSQLWGLRRLLTENMPSYKQVKPAVSFCLPSIPKPKSDVLPAVSVSWFHSIYPPDPIFTSPPTPAFFPSSPHLPAMFLPHFLPTQTIFPVLTNYKAPSQMKEQWTNPWVACESLW